MFRTGLLCRPGRAAGQHQIQTSLLNHGACGAGLFSCRAAHVSSHAQKRPVVQASRAAGQHQMQRTLLNHGACGAGLFSCRAATHGSSHAGLLCRPGEKLQGSTKYRGHFLSMGLVVLASFAAEQQIMALAMLKTGLLCKHGGQACCAGLGELQDSTKYGSTSSSWGMGLVVQASLAAGQQNMAVAMFKRGLLIRSRGAAGQGLQPLLMKGAMFKKKTRTVDTPKFVWPFLGVIWFPILEPLSGPLTSSI